MIVWGELKSVGVVADRQSRGSRSPIAPRRTAIAGRGIEREIHLIENDGETCNGTVPFTGDPARHFL
ncbi:MAG: hypothetical protein D6680_14720 [Cyanobacteria bacterium J007]|nr:MAG: hypothetical protein D6680_14720 [Cyanobacteria bacterium J007]